MLPNISIVAIVTLVFALATVSLSIPGLVRPQVVMKIADGTAAGKRNEYYYFKVAFFGYHPETDHTMQIEYGSDEDQYKAQPYPVNNCIKSWHQLLASYACGIIGTAFGFPAAIFVLPTIFMGRLPSIVKLLGVISSVCTELFLLLSWSLMISLYIRDNCFTHHNIRSLPGAHYGAGAACMIAAWGCAMICNLLWIGVWIDNARMPVEEEEEEKEALTVPEEDEEKRKRRELRRERREAKAAAEAGAGTAPDYNTAPIAMNPEPMAMDPEPMVVNPEPTVMNTEPIAAPPPQVTRVPRQKISMDF